MKKPLSDNLTPLDRESIQVSLGRKPSELELEFIAMARRDELILGPYHDTVRKLKANTVQGETPNHLKGILVTVHGGIQILSPHNTVRINTDIALRRHALKGATVGSVLVDVQLRKPGIQTREVGKRIQSAFTRAKHLGVKGFSGQVQSIPFQSDYGGVVHSFTTGISGESDDGNSILTLPPGCRIMSVYLNSPSRSSANDKNLYTFISSIRKRPWFYGTQAVRDHGLAQALLQLAKRSGSGLAVNAPGATDRDLLEFLGPGIPERVLVVIQNGFEKDAENLCRAVGLDKKWIGSGVKETSLTVMYRKKNLLSISVKAFEFSSPVSDHGFPMKTGGHYPTLDLSKVKEYKNYTRTFRELLAQIGPYSSGTIWESGSPKRLSTGWDHGVVWPDSETGLTLISTLADNACLGELDPRLGGRLTVANAVRQVVCRGAHPLGVSIQNVFPEDTSGEKAWRGHEILLGQEEAVRSLGIPVRNCDVVLTGDLCSQHVGVLGSIHPSRKPMDRSFKEDGHFISILGSHRGELGGSAYLRACQNLFAGPPPFVDLQMDLRLREAVLQGIENRLVLSASNVSNGGIAVALALCLNASAPGLGARIHLSRKLRSDELLFGETQGLVIVTLGEDDLMEFERICMTIGIPSTTIGRVTDDGQFTFNNVLKIGVDSIRDTIAEAVDLRKGE